MAPKKQEDSIIETIKNNYVSAVIGLIIVILGIGYIFNTAKNKNTQTTSDTAQEQTQENEGNTTAPISGNSYTVQKGDTLWKIAERRYKSGYNYVDIVKANKLKNQNSIETGQKLTLPNVESKKSTVLEAKAQPTVAPTVTQAPTATVVPTEMVKQTTKQTKAPITINGTNYTVVKGDHLWSIAVRAYGDGYKWVTIWKANKKMIANPNLIYPGAKLVLPR